LGLGGVVEQSEAFLGELVNAFDVGTVQNAAAVAAQLTVAQVVNVEENDVRLPTCTLD
jgi:hypothetical protein